jgi:uncharacterized protein
MAEPHVVTSRRSTLHRKRERGSYERVIIDAILDEGLVCHVGFNESGSVFVVPTTYARVGQVLYLHGASGNRMLKTLTSGGEACVTVTLLDALVFARSAFHHSMNYRTVMLFGSAEPVDDEAEKRLAVLAIIDHTAQGRSADVREPSSSELRSTRVVRFPITEGSAKIRTGGPIEEPEDVALPIWAGQLPVEIVARAPVPDEGVPEGVAVPPYVAHYPSRRTGATFRTATDAHLKSPTGPGG